MLRSFEVRSSTAQLAEVLSEAQVRTEKTSVGQQAAVGTLGKETTGTKAKGVQCVGRYELFTK